MLVLLVVNSAWAGARPDKSWKNWFGHFYAGYDFASGDFGNLVDNGWTLGGGTTWWPETAPAGLKIDLGYNNFDIASDVIKAIDDATTGTVTTGDVDVWSLTANVIWGPDNSGPVSFYLTGGVGVYYLKGQIGAPGVFTGIICDPWYPFWCYPGAVPGTVIKGEESTTEWGYNAGLGLTIEVGQSGSQIYFEAIYHSAQTNEVTSDYIPLVVGYRW
jgi:opacity protein-like surface antigen